MDPKEKSRLSAAWHERGLLEDAREHMDVERRKLRESGATRKTAREEAWQLAAEQYPPVEGIDAQPKGTASNAEKATSKPDNKRIEVLLAKADGRRPDVLNDVLWVYDHLADDYAEERATSPGAIAMHRWALGNPDKFYQMLASKALSARELARQESEIEVAEEKSIEEMKELVEQLLES